MGDELPEKQDLVALAREDMQWLDQNPELLCSRTERFIAVYRKEIVVLVIIAKKLCKLEELLSKKDMEK
jgi:hypothetical protein